MAKRKIKRKELGKGLGALLSNIESQVKENPEEVTKELSNYVATIPLSTIEVNPYQPRTEFDENALKELSESIKTYGLIQPITVRRIAEGKYQLISGERRWRASQLAGLIEVPAYIRIAEDKQELLEMALVENIQREQLSPYEVAVSYLRLIEECDLTHEQLADRVGKDRTSVSNYIRILKLPPSILNAIKEKEITMGHAKAIMGLEALETKLIVFQEVIQNSLSVRATEQLAKDYKTPQKSNPKAKKILPTAYRDVQDNLRSHFGAKVVLKRSSNGKGQILIPFDSDDDLNRLLDLVEDD